MTARRSSKANSTSQRGSRRTPRKKPKRSLPKISLTLDQWLDLTGLVLVLLALLTSLSFLSNQGMVTGWWLGVLRSVFGWGVYAVPLGLGALGLWLILRHFEEKRPQVQADVFVGVVLVVLTALGTLHLAADLFYEEELGELADQGMGGGHVGRLLNEGLLSAVGSWGTVVVLAALWVIALMFALGISVMEMAQFIGQGWASARGRGNLFSKPATEPDIRINPASAKTAQRHEKAPSQTAPAKSQTGRKTGTSKPSQADKLPSASAPDPTFARAHVIGGQQTWQLPVLAEVFESGGEQELSETEIRERAQIIETTLRSFGVPGRVTEVNRGPTITQFGVEPGYVEGRGGKKTKVKVSRISALADDLALALAAQRIRIETPVPGKSIVGIEVPNAEMAMVALRDVTETDVFEKLRKKTPLPLAMGQDVSGSAVAADLTAMPHLLIAGATGSGKSVCINAILSCLLGFNTPDQVKLILVDPKRVELVPYNGIPHLLVPVVVDLERVVGTLQWVMREMDGRYRKFAKLGARNIADYNRRVAKAGAGQDADSQPLPYIVVIIDELADLMMIAPDET